MQGAPLRLRCEYLEDPVGIDELSPRLSWWPNDSRPAEIQTGYELLAASTRDLLVLHEGDLWNSGRVESSATSLVYRGKGLVSSRRVFWKVRNFDSDGLPSPWSEPAIFEAGLLAPSDWRGQWISAPLTGSPATSVPVPCLRRVFELAAAPKSARLYIAALGLHQIEINGLPISDDVIAPGWCDFDHQAIYQTYDVTRQLGSGANAIGVLLGDGWFSGRTSPGKREHYGRRPELLAQLNLELESGATLIIASDERWQWSASWILSADPIAGESCDWRQHDGNWSSADFASPVFPVLTSGRDLSVRAARQASIRKLRETLPTLQQRSDHRHLFALPGIRVGRARLTGAFPAGAVLRLRYGFDVDAGGQLLDVSAEDVHVAAGSGPAEVLVSQFSLQAFRYVEVSGDLHDECRLELCIEELGQPVEASASFVSDHAGLNELFDTQQGYLAACLQTVPFAALSANRRQGWTADNTLRIKAWLLGHAAAAELGQWLTDVRAAQLEDGGFPAMVPPPPDLDSRSGEPVQEVYADALVEGAWQQFRLLGDRRALDAGYDGIQRYLNALAIALPQHILGEPPGDLYATLSYYRSVRTAARIAGVLGKLVDLEDFELQAAAIRQAFRRRFVTVDGRLVTDQLSAYVGALSQGLLDAPERSVALTELIRHLESGQQSVNEAAPIPGLVPELLQTLTLLGRIESVYERVLSLTSATPGSDAQLAQLARCGVLEWLLGSLAGMDQGRDLAESANAFRRMRIQPRPLLGGIAGGGTAASAGPPVRAVEAALDTINGRYQVSWRITDEAFEITVLVPCNCSADVIMPDDTVHEVVAGEHSFAMPFQHAGDGIPILREVSGG
jgi:alpha-L-rhamnosidase